MITIKKIEDLQETHKIIYVSPINYRKYSMINERNTLYGVTVDFKFLQDILINEYLTSSHLLFYCNLYRHAYQNIKISIAQCYFFADYMKASTKQIDDSMLDNQLFKKKTDPVNQQDQNINNQSQNQFNNNPQQQQNQGIINLSSNNKQWTFQITNITVAQNKDVQNKEKYNVNQLENLLTQMANQNDIKDIQSLNQQDYLYFPINQQNNHWISLIICLKEKMIRYFDSYRSTLNQDIINAAKEILKFIGVIPSEYKISTHFNKQNNGYDCGIFTLISLFYTYQKLPYDYNQSTVTKYRQSILYNLAIVGSQIQVSQELIELIIKLSILQ